jgi:RNAse (barnase) inhibitor barstar
MKEEEPTLVVIDWNQISNVDEFYDSVLSQSEAPSWHGRNLNALNDSWVTGGINRNGPPYRFRIHKIITGNKGMKEIEDAVEEIAKESIEDNGGEIEIN